MKETAGRQSLGSDMSWGQMEGVLRLAGFCLAASGIFCRDSLQMGKIKQIWIFLNPFHYSCHAYHFTVSAVNELLT